MKYNKTIYLTAFLLSLSLILLLEAASLGLLAEDIKPVEKKEVEIELLLSTSNHPAAENTQSEGKQKLKEAKAEQGDNFSEKKETLAEETVKSSSNKNEEKNDHFVEEEEKEVDEAEIKTEKIQQENDLKTEETDETSSENKEVEEKQETMPAWLNNSKNETEEDNSKEAATKKEENEDKFDLDSYLAELENDDSAVQENEVDKEVNKKNENKSDHNLRENESETEGESREKNTVSKSENKKDNAAEEGARNNEEQEVYNLREGGNDIQKPGLKNYAQPEYPSNLRKRNIEGEVIISLRIDKAGKAHDLKISQSSGYDSFDQAALSAVSNWRFEAAEKDGIKVEVIVNLPIRFKLN
ncbi:TonB family protein [Halanaerobium saccharolyticum]|uniref:TonB family protein n=1 Tax=Halanaerobium saccharolyticum TaxID=43595 RepID=A0A2T5RIF3_9FIRM|nr:energy transducer TonB [Halanaerobium saccharolyticum]PTV98026.1 TonB family protein [Halanaerobium saccharolyticum]TDP97040.1 TonB family protein [Halanaerobium saccharolyticum]